MVIFHSYVSLPEGKPYIIRYQLAGKLGWNYPGIQQRPTFWDVSYGALVKNPMKSHEIP